MRAGLVLIFIMLFSFSCGGGGGGDDQDTASRGSDGAAQDTASPGQDTGADTVEGADLGGEPQPDTLVLPDVPVGVDAVPGSLALGENCSADLQCESGLCFSSAAAAGCTIPCASQVECQAYGLLCVQARPNQALCVPPFQGSGANCQDNSDCEHPLYCRLDLGWCELPECTFDQDCPVGKECELSTRECQVLTCVSTYECRNPAQVCKDGACTEPDCRTSDQCGEGSYCHPTQKICSEGLPCNEDGTCSYYNQVCVDALCVPNLCVAECPNAGEQCDPASGKCGPLCPAGTCPEGSACADSGICYQNAPPLAVITGTSLEVQVGQSVSLSGADSIDPEGGGLEYQWMILAAPPGSGKGAGTSLGTTVTASFTPDLPGNFLAGLRVRDSGGLWSVQALIGLVAH